MIHLQHTRFAYPGGGFELSVDDLRVEAGAHAAVVGPSGSGKSTLLNLVAGVLKPNSGSVTVDGRDIGALDGAARRRFRAERIGLVFQQLELVDYLDVRDNILLPSFLQPALPLNTEIRRRAETLAGAAGVADKLGRPIDRLSQGERQRVAICRALIHTPSLILADEPTGSLDPESAAGAMQLLRSSATEAGATLLVVTHDHAAADRFERVIDLGASAETREAAP